MREIDTYFIKQEEPVKSCMLFLRAYILSYEKEVTEGWRYGMPFYFFRKKRFCYLWIQKKTCLPYLGLVDGNLLDHPCLIQEGRTRMKVLLVDPRKDIPLKTINAVLSASIKLHVITT